VRDPDLKRLKKSEPRPGSLAKKIVVAVIAFLAAAGITVVLLLFFSGICHIDRVEVIGAKNVDPGKLRKLSGVDGHTNLLTLPSDEIAANVEKNPWVKDAKVEKDYFHTVRIKVTERVPIALLNIKGTGYLVDRQGFVIAGCDPAQFQSLPHVHGGDSKSPQVERMLPNGRLREAAMILGAMTPAIRETVGIINPYDGRGNVMVSRDGFQIVYGEREESGRKNEVLEAIVADIKSNARRATYIDVRVPDSPVVLLH